MTKSDACAQHDGIKMEWRRGKKIYFIPCHVCGHIIERKQYTSEKTYLCDYCKLSVKEKQTSENLERILQNKSKKELLFDKAVEELKQQVPNLDSYQKAIKAALSRVERYGSIPEMMVAIELLHLRYQIIPQQRIGKYRVDFVIPSTKLVLEVDGSRYHDGVDMVRDSYIKLRLGYEWEVVHVSAELIRSHIKTLGRVISDAKLRHQTKK